MPWLRAGDFPAAPLGDLRTSVASRLSVWHIEGDRSNLKEVVAALAATRDHADKFDFALFPEGVLQEAQIRAEVTRGDSLDLAANQKWHRDLVELSSAKLVRLAELIHLQGQIERLLENEVTELIREGVEAGQLDQRRLNDQLRIDVLGA